MFYLYRLSAQEHYAMAAVQNPVVDPQHEKELFVSEIAGVAVLHGNIVVNLATVRFDERVGGEKPKPRRVIVGRLVLTSPAAGQLMKHLQRLAMQAEAATPPPPEATRN
jgi:hypothetical protein